MGSDLTPSYPSASTIVSSYTRGCRGSVADFSQPKFRAAKGLDDIFDRPPLHLTFFFAGPIALMRPRRGAMRLGVGKSVKAGRSWRLRKHYTGPLSKGLRNPCVCLTDSDGSFRSRVKHRRSAGELISTFVQERRSVQGLSATFGRPRMRRARTSLATVTSGFRSPSPRRQQSG